VTDHFAPHDPEAEERERDIQRDTHIAARTTDPGSMAPSDGARPDVCDTCHTERCETCHACPCSRGEDWTCGSPDCPATRVRHSGPDTKFCVLCLSGEHERVATPASAPPSA
jgi:hypothetical protein